MHPLELTEKYNSSHVAGPGANILPGITEVLESRVVGLNGVPAPNYDLKKENNAHRVMLYLAAAGNNGSEIAGITGYSPEHVSIILRQPWFQTQLTRLIEESGKPVIDQLLQNEAKNCLTSLLALRDGPTTPPSVKAAVSINILDRVLGKAVQKTESINHNFNRTSTMSMEELEREQERLEKEELRLRGA